MYSFQFNLINPPSPDVLNDHIEKYFSECMGEERIVEYVNRELESFSIRSEGIIQKESKRGCSGEVFPIVVDSFLYENLYDYSFVMKVGKCGEEDSLRKDCIKLPFHPNICPVRFYKSIERDENPSEDPYGSYCVLMKNHKNTLSVALKRFVDIKGSVVIMNGIIEGAYHLHKNNVAHRDLHSGNILVDDFTKRVRISDFGKAIDFSSRKNLDEKERFVINVKKDDTLLRGKGSDSSREFHGSPPFTAPEILNFNEKVDEIIDYSKADIYSVGVNFQQIIKELEKKENHDNDEKSIMKELKDVVKHLIIENPNERWDFVTLRKEFSKFLCRWYPEFFFMIEMSKGRWFYKRANKYFIKTRFNEMIRCLDKSLEVFKNMKMMKLSLHELRYLDVNIANVHFTRGKCLEYIFEYENSLADYQKAFQIRKKNENVLPNGFKDQNKVEIAECENRIGFILIKLDKYEEAEKYLQSSLNSRMELHHCCKHQDIARSYLNYGLLLMEWKEYEMSEKCFMKAIEIFEIYMRVEKKKTSSDIAYTKYVLGQMYFYSGDYEKSLESYSASFSVRKKILPMGPNVYHPKIGFCIHDMGLVFLKLGNVDLGMKYLTCAKAIFKRRLKDLPSEKESSEKLVASTTYNISLIRKFMLEEP